MSKNEQTATMYESIPAVAELNKVPGFNPLKLLRRIVSPENGEAVLQLDLPYKKLWFRLANPKGRIRLNALRITEQMAIYEAQIYLERTDENPIGSFTSSCTKEEAPGGQYIQAAQQMAMDEALSDAGFGIQFADVNMGANGSRYGSRIPLNGAASNKNESIPAGTGTVSRERVQPSAAPAGGMVKTFQAAAGKAGTSGQEKPAQESGLPVQEKMTAADTGTEEKKTADNRLAVGTAAETKAPPESAAENGNLMAGLPAGMQGSLESLPADPENRTGNLAVQPATEQKMTEQLPAMSTETVKIGEAADRVQAQTENNSLPAGPQTEVQKTAQSAGTGELPVKAAEAEGLPVQKNAGLPAADEPGNVLPASEKNNVEEDTRKAVQGMMALLGGQNITQKTAAASTGASGSVENTQIKAPASEVQNLPATRGAVSEIQSLPAAENQAQGNTDARYTPDMPVEEIVKLMTFEEAGQVVVDMGVCKGQTIAEVAERRPPSLKFYLYGGYRGDNNILRAAAQIMLDSLAAKKAG